MNPFHLSLSQVRPGGPSLICAGTLKCWRSNPSNPPSQIQNLWGAPRQRPPPAAAQTAQPGGENVGKAGKTQLDFSLTFNNLYCPLSSSFPFQEPAARLIFLQAGKALEPGSCPRALALQHKPLKFQSRRKRCGVPAEFGGTLPELPVLPAASRSSGILPTAFPGWNCSTGGAQKIPEAQQSSGGGTYQARGRGSDNSQEAKRGINGAAIPTASIVREGKRIRAASLECTR